MLQSRDISSSQDAENLHEAFGKKASWSPWKLLDI